MKELKGLSEAYQTMINYLYPKRCPVCDEVLSQGVLLCQQCTDKVEFIGGKRCVKCSKPFDDLEHNECYDCRKQMHEYEYGIALFEYHSIVDSLFRFKYAGRCEYATYYGVTIAKYLGERIRQMNVDAIIPIPLHAKKLQFRGYNQAQLIGEELGKQLQIPVISDLVERVRNTKPQKLLTGVNRQNNLKKAFHIAHNEVKLSTVLLIDDIYTTGNTINEVARELKRKRVQKIYFITVAIGNGF